MRPRMSFVEIPSSRYVRSVPADSLSHISHLTLLLREASLFLKSRRSPRIQRRIASAPTPMADASSRSLAVAFQPATFSGPSYVTGSRQYASWLWSDLLAVGQEGGQ